MFATCMRRLRRFYNACLRSLAGFNRWTQYMQNVTDAHIRSLLGAPPLEELPGLKSFRKSLYPPNLGLAFQRIFENPLQKIFKAAQGRPGPPMGPRWFWEPRPGGPGPRQRIFVA